MGMTRREALKLLGLSGLAVAGCKTASGDDGASEGDAISIFHCVGHDDAEALARASAVSPEQFRKYEKIVVLMMENRSFDHYFGHLSMPTALGGEGRTDVDGLKGNETQLLDRGNGLEQFGLVHPSTFKLGDIDHEWDACHGQFNGGQMDGFIRMHWLDLQRKQQGGSANCGSHCAAVGDPMSFYTRNDTPVLHQLFDNYALCDRWFSSVMGPTWPNRFYLHAATSQGIKTNDRMDTSSNPGPGQVRHIWHELHDKCVSAMNYAVDFPFVSGGFGLLTSTPQGKVFNWQKNNNSESNSNDQDVTFEEACAAGTLPIVSVIDPGFVTTPTDDHPPHDVSSGQAFIASIYKMLTSNQAQWEKTLLIITYDEHGSFYDHVKPPQVGAEEPLAEFRQLGFRVPALVVGPYIKKNFVSHVQYDHVSFLSTITRRLGLTPLNQRVVTANDVRDCVDMNLLERGNIADPVQLQSVNLSESLVHESIRESLGQSELALATMGRPATLEEKRRATDLLLGGYDRLGVASIGR
jgi:phospholipase C